MKRKFVWLVLSGLMVLVLVAASCAPAPKEEAPATPVTPAAPAVKEEAPAVKEAVPAEGKEMVKLSLTKRDGTVVEKLVEKPRYGGVAVEALNTPEQYLDDFYGHASRAPNMSMTSDKLVMWDWARGPAGTGEYGFMYYYEPTTEMTGVALAESWELPDDQTTIYHLRKGVRFHNKPPTNGREMTSDDVVFSLLRLWRTSTVSWFAVGYPWDEFCESITAPDKWTVVVKSKPARQAPNFTNVSWMNIVPRDAVEKAGGNLQDWRNSIGTGPFMLVNYVPASSMTFVRNPNYWHTDPLHPQNEIPYLDGLKFLVIIDESTRMAALRTGKLDLLRTVPWEDAVSLLKTNPELGYLECESPSLKGIAMRSDKPELPYADRRVRRALMLAINKQEMVDSLYGGHAKLYSIIMNIPEHKDMIVPFEELPEEDRELFGYHPDKAKKLLAEAGYPNGFTAKVLLAPDNVDLFSVVKEYWAKIGVDLQLDVKEANVVNSITSRGLHEEMTAGSHGLVPYRFNNYYPAQVQNNSKVNDPRINAGIDYVWANYWNTAVRDKGFKEKIFPLYVSEVYYIALPAGNNFELWQPWFRNFQGEWMVGYAHWRSNHPYSWIDQDLKEAMTGRR